MSGRGTILLLALLAGAVRPTSGQDAASPGPRTVAPAEVRSWTVPRDGRRWAIRPATPTALGDTGLFRLVGSAYTLPGGLLSVSVFRDNADRDPRGTDFSTHGFSVAYGVTDRLEIFGAVGVEHRVRARYLDEAGGPNEDPFVDNRWQTGFGDVGLGAKYAFANDLLGDEVGLALRVFGKIPAADAERGLGTGEPSFGGDVLVSKTLGLGDLHGSAGYEFNRNPDPPVLAADPLQIAEDTTGSDYVANAVRWGVGLNLPASGHVALQAELSGRIYGHTTVEQTNTVDVIVGLALWLRPGLFIRPAWGYALGYDGRGREVSFGRRSGFHLAFGFHGGTLCCAVRVPSPSR
jgi:hypothetical protein